MSTKSVKTRAYDDLRLIRRARPYRMAVIELSFESGNNVSYRYIFNEFGNLVSSFTRASQGLYELQVVPGFAKNINNVALEGAITQNTLNPFQIVILAYQYNSTYNTIYMQINDTVFFSPIDLEGKILMIIKEYY